ncbi:hypothetical protein KIN20_003352 [Parelaphostrongylus tenuis]|uniref:Uncharacterized protein n=1 Tax=Parelaphostrongylus tenuis TaxID=148309 RepID=A0AAD5MI53_PARTN|nr:hypothetical protein KIN20_003352 [Parelaphostrongylus tenuis]
MRAVMIALLPLLIAIAFADDKTLCGKRCAEKYGEADIRSACNTGCDARPGITQGPMAFVDCFKSCDSEFKQENGTDDESEAHAACSYACSLPMTRSLFMSVKYNNDEKPVVEIVRKEGDEVVDSGPHMGGTSVDQLLSGILGHINRVPVIKNPLIEHDSQSEEDRNSSVKGLQVLTALF